MRHLGWVEALRMIYLLSDICVQQMNKADVCEETERCDHSLASNEVLNVL